MCTNPISATPSKKVEGINPTRDDPQEIPKDIEVNLVNIGVNKLNKYKFPVRDVIDPKSCSKPFTKEQCIEHIVNLSACRLDTDTYNFWNLVANRDVAYPELSKNGIQATKYDLKQQLALFKKSREKIEYISRLKNSNGKDTKTGENKLSKPNSTKQH